MDDSLYVEGEIGFSIGGNAQGPLRFKNVQVTNNVLLDLGRGRPTLRDLGWGLDIQDWGGGLVACNCFVHQASPDIRNVYAINVTSGDEKGERPSETSCRYGRQSVDSAATPPSGDGRLPVDSLRLLMVG